MTTITPHVVTTSRQLEQMVFTITFRHSGLVGFDTEGTSERPEDAALVGMSFAIQTDDGDYIGWYIPVGHSDGLNIDRPFLLSEVAQMLQTERLVMHGGKYDLRLMWKYGIDLNLALDSLSVVRLTGEVDYGIGLKETVRRWFGEEVVDFKSVKGKKATAADVPTLEMAGYAIADAVNALRVANEGMSRLPEQVKRTLLANEVEVMKAAAAMEDHGLPVDMEFLRGHQTAGELALVALEAEAIDGLTSLVPAKKRDQMPEKLNLRSAPQLQKVLFDLGGLKPITKSKKTGKPSASKGVIERLAVEVPAVGTVARYRSAATTLGRVEELMTYSRERNGWRYVHASLNPTGAATGRWTSSGPNAQNYPREPYVYDTTEGPWEVNIRDAIAAPPGFIIVSADYGQVELRVAAGMSQERRWLDAFANDVDIHTATAAAVFGKPVDDITKDERYIGKTLNFSMLFGAQEGKVADLLGISKDQAGRIIERFWRGLPSVAEWVGRVRRNAFRRGFVETAYGRRRHLPDLYHQDKWVVEKAMRESVNTVVQGTAADILKYGLVRQRPLEAMFGAHLFLVVHDQFVWVVPDDQRLDNFALSMGKAICPTINGFPEIVTDFGVGSRLGSLQMYDGPEAVPSLTGHELIEGRHGETPMGNKPEQTQEVVV